MLFLLIALAIAALLAIALFMYSGSGYQGRHDFAGVVGIILGIVTAVVAVGYAVIGFSWFAAESKANIINREYGTHYTREEIFYASDVIDTIRQIDRKRIEVNGNVMRGDDHE